jgi:hypothetical protein
MARRLLSTWSRFANKTVANPPSWSHSSVRWMSVKVRKRDTVLDRCQPLGGGVFRPVFLVKPWGVPLCTSRFPEVHAVLNQALNQSLAETDPELFDIIEKEKRRQQTNLVLIASENFASRAVFDALGSVMSNKYSEGYPGAR